MPAARRFLVSLAGLLASLPLTGCSVLDALEKAPPYSYQCPHGLRFTAHLYRDMAMLDGLNGHAVLARETPDVRVTDADGRGDAPPGNGTGNSEGAAESLRYADDSVRAQFGLGLQGRLARLDYANIPDPIYCVRLAPARMPPGASLPPLHAVRYDGPRPPPPPPDPDAPVRTNIRAYDRVVGPGRMPN